jgi:hypothetical protein
VAFLLSVFQGSDLPPYQGSDLPILLGLGFVAQLTGTSLQVFLLPSSASWLEASIQRSWPKRGCWRR